MAERMPEGVPILSLANPSHDGLEDMFSGQMTPTGSNFQQAGYVAAPQDAQYTMHQPNPENNGQYLTPNYQYDENEQDRPMTAASTNTYQQAQTLFTDFDGTHYAPSILPTLSEAGSSTSDQVNRLSAMFRAPPRFPPPSNGMVFYPAPVPTNLNLPQRLSRALPTSVEAKRRTQMLATITPDARKSAIWLDGNAPNLQDAAGAEDPIMLQKRMSTLPPQLRASMFFENPTSISEVKVRDKSAMATLEDLLDASTTAPVSAFTDHPFAGKVGSDVYKRAPAKRISTMPDFKPPPLEKRRSSFLGFGRFSMSSGDLLAVPESGAKKRASRAFSMGGRLDDSSLNRNSSGFFGRAKSETDALSQHDSDHDPELDFEDEDDGLETPEDDEDEDLLARHGPPTTLLAELQYRKEIQKQRNRTAITSFPNGMHSTLLELDAVAQIQKQKRQTARVTLAWEDPDHVKSTEKQEPEDEDVPLGVLYAAKAKVQAHHKERGLGDWDRPLGLIELREREDNEPLSHRRARLRGIDPYAPRDPSPQKSMLNAPIIQIDDQESEDENPEETLADRRKRLAAQKELEQTVGEDNVRVISQAFSSDLNLDSLALDGGSSEQLAAIPVAEEEETLGQRRARLQKLAQQQSQLSLAGQDASQIPQARPSMPNRASTSFADLLHHVPNGTTRKVSDKDLMASMPQDSLLKQSEDLRAARREALLSSQNAYTQATTSYDNRQSMAFRSASYGNGLGAAVPGTNAPQRPLLNVRQSTYSVAAQSQLGLNMYPNAQGMGADPLMLQQLQTLQNMNMAASTPNLLGGVYGVMPQPMQQRQSTMMGYPMQMQMQMQMSEEYLDPKVRTRVDAWRQSVQMD